MSTDLMPTAVSTLAVGLRPLSPPCQEDLSDGDMARLLADYLRGHLGLARVRFADPPTALSDGWETYTYRFRLRAEDVPAEWRRPLVLRVHAGPEGAPRVKHEVAVQQFLHAGGYPVPKVVATDDRPTYLGGPFLVMHEIRGRMLMQTLLHAPWRLVAAAARMAGVHARLHGLPPDGFPVPEERFADANLSGITDLIDRYDLTGLRRGLDWLRKTAPKSAAPSIIHQDFHPLNVLVRADGAYTVIDWTYADIGDPHADVATTLMLMECVPVRGQSWLNRFATSLGRPLLCSAYLREYQRRRPLDTGRLAYFRAWASLRRLALYGRWLKAGPTSAGCKAGLLARLDPFHIAALERHFQTWSGVPAHLAEPTP